MLDKRVEVLLKKQTLYREIDTTLLNLSSIYASHKRFLQLSDLCTAFERDKAVTSLRFLCTFYDTPPEVFFLSSTLFDSLLENKQISSAMFDVIHVSCFCVSAISYGHLIRFEDVVKFSSYTGNIDVFYSTTNFLLGKLQMSSELFPTILTLMKLFLVVLLPQDEVFFVVCSEATRRLALLVCCHKFNFFKVEEFVLCLCHFVLKEMDIFGDELVNERMVELHHHYQVNQQQYSLCLEEMESHMHRYDNQKSVNPRLKLSWTISKKLLLKMKPSTKFISKLECVMEAENSTGDAAQLGIDVEENVEVEETPMLVQNCEENYEEISAFEENKVNSTFRYDLISLTPSRIKFLYKMLLNEKGFVICLTNVFPSNECKTLADAKLQPAHLPFMSMSNLPCNQFNGSQLVKRPSKRRKNYLRGELSYILVISGGQPKYLLSPICFVGHFTNSS